jgi:carboxyl-terminal processing protease
MTFSCVPAWTRFAPLMSVLTLLLSSAMAWAQVKIPQAALESPTELTQVYHEGSLMEESGRWGEALSLYEKASKRFPQDPRLKAELSEARLHFDVRRRYSDSSFVRMVKSASLRDSLEIYQEILLKIKTFHVDQPDWTGLVRRGAEAFLVTVDSKDFSKQFEVTLDDFAQQRITDYLNQETLSKQIVDRNAAQIAVHDFAVMMHEAHGIPAQAVVMEFATGATTALDWYSSFLTTDQYSEVMSQIDGNFVGLGVELKPGADFLDVISVIPAGPAGRGGIKAGDRIMAVDRRTVTQLGGNFAADLLRGPEGSWVQLNIQTPDGTHRELKLKRARVDIPSVEEHRLVDRNNGVAYLKLASFQRTTSQEVTSALWELHRQGMRSLVLDLRGNPGGLLDAAVDVADMFLTSGTIVTTKGRNIDENSVRRAKFEGTWRVPLVVLIDENSASASEILAGALRDNHRATVVGNRSYGKGSVQGIFSLNSCSAGIRLTTAKFYSPSGRAISHAGVDPDISIPEDLSAQGGKVSPEDRVVTLRTDLNSDPSLDMAIRVATRQLQRLNASN